MEVAPRAFAEGRTPVVRDGRVAMHGLYLASCSMLERAYLRVLEPFDCETRPGRRRTTELLRAGRVYDR